MLGSMISMKPGKDRLQPDNVRDVTIIEHSASGTVAFGMCTNPEGQNVPLLVPTYNYTQEEPIVDPLQRGIAGL